MKDLMAVLSRFSTLEHFGVYVDLTQAIGHPRKV